MFKVIIVDDESRIRKGLVTLIPWETYGFKVVGTAENGNDAIEKYNILLPDLLVVDMKMPGMSGIELIESLRIKSSTVHFLILSGHAEFEYAKLAITHNVDGYLLKPIDEEEVLEYLKIIKIKLCKEIESEKKKFRLSDEYKEQLTHTVLTGENLDGIKDINRYLYGPKYSILLIKLEDQTDFKINIIKTEIKGIFEEGNLGVVLTMSSFLCVLLNSSFDSSKQKRDILKRLTIIFRNSQSDFNAAIGSTIDKLEDMSKSYQVALKLIRNRFFYEEDHILNESSQLIFNKNESGDFKVRKDVLSINRVIDNLFYALEIEDKQAISQTCKEAIKQMIEADNSEYQIKRNFIQIVSAIQTKVLYEYKNNKTTLLNFTPRIFEIENQSNIKTLLLYTDSLLFEILENMDLDKTDNLVKKMINLIELNYNKNIKLDTLAEVLNYSRPYLGQLFKSGTGEYFNTYLDKLRIEKGKKLLLGEVKIYEVANRIGYSNVDYFYSKFKKYEGISPSSYRKKFKELDM